MSAFVEMALWALAILAGVYFIYLIFFSGHERLRKQLAEQRKRHRFERREMEKKERRENSAGPPDGEDERRKSYRR